MYTSLELLFGCILAFFFGGTIVGVTFLIARRNLSYQDDFKVDTVKVTERVTPFIKIHRSIIEDDGVRHNPDSVNRLKEKIESFKFRNKFYKN